MKNLIFGLGLLLGTVSFAAITNTDKAELGVSTNYILNGGAERGIAGFAKYFDGQTFTVTIASPGVITTSSAHNLIVGDKVYLTTTGSLPTGLATATLYYVSVVGSSTTFQLTATAGGTSINTSGTQSGTHTYRPYSVHGATGGTASHLTLSSTTSSPLAGNRSWTIANSGSTSAMGEGVSYQFTLDTAQKGKTQEIVFDYQVTSGTFQTGSLVNGTFTDSDVEVYIWDVTNSVPIVPSRMYLDCGSSTSVQCSFSSTFLASSTSTSYRVSFHVATTNTVAWTIKGDSLKVRPYAGIMASADTDWASYTPTITGFGTATAVTGRWRKIAGNVEIEAKFTAGTTAASEARVSLPTGLTSVSSIQTLEIAGTVIKSDAGASSSYALIEPGVTYVTFGLQSGTTGGLAKYNGNNYTTGSTLTVIASVPIAGWSASQSAVRADQSNFDWTPYTPTFTGLGTVSPGSINYLYRRNGSNLEVQGTHVNGTTTASLMSISLPGGYSIDATKLGLSNTTSNPGPTIGTWVDSGSTVSYTNMVAATGTSTSVVYFGGFSNGAAKLTPANGNNSGTGVTASVNFKVPIQFWNENQNVPQLVGSLTSSTSGLERIERVNITGSATPTISSQSGDWAVSVARPAAGRYTLTVKSGYFSSAPTCTCRCKDAGNGAFCQYQNASTSTSVESQCVGIVAGSPTSQEVDREIICMGPR